jgi:hypothetical protein
LAGKFLFFLFEILFLFFVLCREIIKTGSGNGFSIVVTKAKKFFIPFLSFFSKKNFLGVYGCGGGGLTLLALHTLASLTLALAWKKEEQ